MTPFFRRIRHKLANDNQFLKYSRYAIGEILLVVVGILIALQINNYNQERINEKKIANILKEIQNDLIKDIEYFKIIFDYQIYTDSISKIILNDKYTYKDYTTRNFRTIGYNYRDYRTVTNGYDNLKRNIDNIPEKYSSIIDDLKNLYELEKQDLDVYNKRIRATVYKNVDEEFSFNWFLENQKLIMSEEEINYRLHDNHYKKMVQIYMNDRRNLFSKGKSYKKNAISLYNKISKLIKSKDSIPENVSYNSIKDSLGLNDIVGTYELKETVNAGSWDQTIQIKELNNEILYSDQDGDLEVFWYNKSIFTLGGSSAFFVFNRSKKGELYISYGTNISSIYEKMK